MKLKLPVVGKVKVRQSVCRDWGVVISPDLIGRIDADSILEPEWVAEVKALFSDPTVGAATGPMIYYDMPMRRWGARHSLGYDFAHRVLPS